MTSAKATTRSVIRRPKKIEDVLDDLDFKKELAEEAEERMKAQSSTTNGASPTPAMLSPDAEKASEAKIKSGFLEESNVNPISSIVRMVELHRHFEAIQKSINVVMNEVNSKAIDKLGR